MPNAIMMLREDHRKVKGLFEQFEQGDESAKEQIAEQTLHELEVHTRLEEEIFYPAAREHLDEPEKIDEALEEHHVAKLLVSELKKMDSDDKRFDAKYKVLAESVKHHIQEEECSLFPMLEDGLDAEEVGQRMETRKQKLQQQLSSASGTRRSKTKSRSKTGGKRAKSRQTTGKKRGRRAVSGRR